MLTGAGFTVERLLELNDASARNDPERARLIPHTLAFKTRKR